MISFELVIKHVIKNIVKIEISNYLLIDVMIDEKSIIIKKGGIKNSVKL